VTKVEDWDAWTHLALGREMVQGRALPALEPIVFPSARLPYHNTEWLFDVVMYSVYLLGGLTGVILLKAALASLVTVILWGDSAPAGGRPADPGLDAMLRAAVLFPVLLLIWHRFTERPDLALMVFLSVTIYALNAYLADGRWHLLYALPALHTLWANTHPSVVLTCVPFSAVLLPGLGLRLVHRRLGIPVTGLPSPRQLRTIAIIFAAVLLASLINPHGPEVFTLPFRLAASSWFQLHVLELQPPSFLVTLAPLILTALLALTALALVRRLPVAQIVLVLPFVFLAFTAARFVFLLPLVAGPVLARNVSLIAVNSGRRWGQRVWRGCAVGTAAIGVIGVALTLARVEPLADPTKTPGVGVNDAFLPERALGYLDRAGVTGRVFNTFHWGGYLAWRDFPRRAPIIDGRGYVPPGLLETIYFATAMPDLLERLHVLYGFEVVLIAYPGMSTDPVETPEAAMSSTWALVYWDDVAVVYLRRSERLAAVVARDEYRYVNPGNGVPHLQRALTDASKSGAIEREVRRNVADTRSSIGHTMLGYVHLERGEHDQAIASFRRAQGYSSVWPAAQGLALAYWVRGDHARAIEYYKALASVAEDPTVLHNAGLALMQMGKDRDALPYFERARARDPQLLPVYPTLIGLYRRLGLPDREREVSAAHDAALRFARATEHVRRAAGLRHTGDLEAAVSELEAALRLHPGHAMALSSLGEVYLEQGRLEEAIRQQRAALDAHPAFARAHHALGMAYRRRGDHRAARQHFEASVRLEPASYRAWQARQELSQLPR
jgi:tetratricopeptide (TPR) repeat protein